MCNEPAISAVEVGNSYTPKHKELASIFVKSFSSMGLVQYMKSDPKAAFIAEGCKRDGEVETKKLSWYHSV